MNVPRLALLVFPLVLLFSCDQKSSDTFTVSGTVKNASADVIFLEEAALGSMQPVIVDSARLNGEGKFELSTLAKEEGLYVLRLPQQVNPVASLINDTKKITVQVDLANADQPYTVKGSPASQQLIDYLSNSNRQLSSLYALGVQLDSQQKKGVPDSLLVASRTQLEQAAAAFRRYAEQTISGSKSPSLSIFTIGSYQSYASNGALGLPPFTHEELGALVNQTAARFPQHAGLASLKATMQAAPQQESAPAPSALLNKPAPEFTLPDVTGKPLSLSSFRGQYVLVDFWASWCPPCREENPNVVAAYQQFKTKNFTVLGVSLDKEKAPWQKAIAADGLAWTQVSDLQFWESAVVPLYRFEGIPYNVLVDPNGVVIAENLRGGALQAKLQEVLK